MQPVEKFSISLPPEMAKALRESVADGDYSSTTEAVRDAIRIWQTHRVQNNERLSVLRERVQSSLADPAPSLTIEEIDGHIAMLLADAEHAGGNGTA